MAITTIIFDLDETLITDERATYLAFQQAATCAHTHYSLDTEQLWHAAYAHAEELWHAAPTLPFCELLGISASEGLWGNFENPGPQWQALKEWVPSYKVQVWEYALAEQGYTDHALAQQMATIFQEARLANQELFPETLAVLQALRPHYKLAMLTNGAPDLQHLKIRQSNLAEYFDIIVVSGEVGVGKPDPKVFQAVLNPLGVLAHEAAMVGDSLRRDIEGAARSGLQGIWVNRDTSKCDQRYVPLIHKEITSLEQLPYLTVMQ